MNKYLVVEKIGQGVALGLLVLILAQFSYAEVAFRDPTQPVDYVPVGKQQDGVTGLKLDSVLISDQRKFAVINGKTVKEKQWVDGAQVVRILPDAVDVVVQGKPMQLHLINQIRNKNEG